jgi:hypothetical protein
MKKAKVEDRGEARMRLQGSRGMRKTARRAGASGSSRADTGHAIHVAAHLAHLLLLLLITELNRPHISARAVKKLDGFAKRIRLARALGLIDDTTHKDLKAIDDVRAVLTHAERPVRFTSVPVRIKARGFQDWKPGASVRQLFDEAAARAEAAISGRLNRVLYEDAIARGLAG